MSRNIRALLRPLFVAIAATSLSTSIAVAQTPNDGVPGVPFPAVDALNRPIADCSNAPEPRSEKKVGLFYFLWFESKTNIPTDKNAPEDAPRPYNISQIEKIDPRPTQRDDLLGANAQMHYWGEPLFGYYDARDPYVIRRHLQLIADAGVDVLVFDATNVETYPDVYLPLCDQIIAMKRAGYSAPQVAFMTNTRVEDAVRTLWKDFYSRDEYRDAFFLWKGKPLLIAKPEEVPEELREFFTLRAAYWPTNGPHNSHNQWRWVDAYPQAYSWSDDENVAEQMVVSPAQNVSRDADAHDVWMSEGIARGRSFVYGSTERRRAPDEGRNFAQQWSRVFELDPEFLLITGWNEWIAGRWKIEWAGNRYTFVDQYDWEYSRDLEPTRGLHLDNYYLQMVDGIRKFKGVAPQPDKAPRLNDAPDWEKWSTVAPTLRDYVGDAEKRDFDGKGGTRYRNESGRNDLTIAKVARDGAAVYFYLESAEPFANPLDGLVLALDLDGDLTTGLRGADALIGRRYGADGEVSAERYDPTLARAVPELIQRLTKGVGLDEYCAVEDLVERQDRPYATEEQEKALQESDERLGAEVKVAARLEVERLRELASGWRTSSILEGAKWRADGNRVVISVPLSLFKDGDELASVNFKWLDNLPAAPSASDFYDQGDVAPEGAFFYRVEFE